MTSHQEIDSLDKKVTEYECFDDILGLITSDTSIDLKCKQTSENLCKKTQYKGYILGLLSALLFAITGILLKLSTNVPAGEELVMRFIIQLVIIGSIILYRGENLFGNKDQRVLLTFRGFLGALSLFAFYFAFKFIDPSDCIALTHSSLIVTLVLSRIFLKEKLSTSHLLALVFTIVGILFISQPTFLFGAQVDRNHLTVFIGTLLALLCAFSYGSSQVLLRKLCTNNISFTLPMIYVSYFGIPMSTILLTYYDINGFKIQIDFVKFYLDYAYIILASFVGLLAQVLTIMALKYEQASHLSIIQSIDIFISYFLQYFLLNLPFDLFSIIGSCAIFLGASIVLAMKIFEESKVQLVCLKQTQMKF